MKKILITLFAVLSSVEALANQPKNWQLGFQESCIRNYERHS
jgi:cytochrome c oxidase subunit 2